MRPVWPERRDAYRQAQRHAMALTRAKLAELGHVAWLPAGCEHLAAGPRTPEQMAQLQGWAAQLAAQATGATTDPERVGDALADATVDLEVVPYWVGEGRP